MEINFVRLVDSSPLLAAGFDGGTDIIENSEIYFYSRKAGEYFFFTVKRPGLNFPGFFYSIEENGDFFEYSFPDISKIEAEKIAGRIISGESLETILADYPGEFEFFSDAED